MLQYRSIGDVYDDNDAPLPSIHWVYSYGTNLKIRHTNTLPFYLDVFIRTDFIFSDVGMSWELSLPCSCKHFPSFNFKRTTYRLIFSVLLLFESDSILQGISSGKNMGKRNGSPWSMFDKRELTVAHSKDWNPYNLYRFFQHELMFHNGGGGREEFAITPTIVTWYEDIRKRQSAAGLVGEAL